MIARWLSNVLDTLNYNRHNRLAPPRAARHNRLPAPGSNFDRLEDRLMMTTVLTGATDLGTVGGLKTVSDTVTSAHAEIVYKFALSKMSDVMLSTNRGDSNVRHELIWDKNNNGRVDDGEKLSFDYGATPVKMRLATGSYYVRVVNNDGVTNDFTLSIASTTAPADIGNTLDTARNLGSISGPATYDDWVGATDSTDVYCFTVTSMSDVSIITNRTDSNVRHELIWDKNDNGKVDEGERLSFDYGSNPAKARLAAGTYFLRLVNNNGVNNPYSLTLTTTAVPVTATKLDFETIPSVPFGGTGTVIVRLTDKDGNLAASNNSEVTLSLASGPSGTVLGGTLTVKAVNGIATFDNVTFSKLGNYTLKAVSSGLTAATSKTFTVTPDIASARLVVVSQPGETILGKTAKSLVVQLQDQYGNLITTLKSNVTLAIATGPDGATITGTAKGTLSNGVVTFSKLSFLKVGSYKLQINAGGLESITTESFNVSITPAKLVITTQPTATTIAGHALAPIVLQIQDAAGHLDAANNSDVTITIASKTSAALGGTLTVKAVNGIVTFSDLVFTAAGTYTLKIASGSLKAAVTRSFTITPDAATSHLVLITPPTTATVGKTVSTLMVKVVDQYGNLVKSDNSKLTLRLDGSATGNFTVSNNIKFTSGVAIFKNLTVKTAGSYELSFQSSGAGIATLVAGAPLVVSQATATITKPTVAKSYTTNQNITLTAKATSNAPTTIAFGGTVLLKDGSNNTLATGTISATGAIKFTFTAPLPGSYTCTVVYSGDTNHTSAVSAPFNLVIVKAASATKLAASIAKPKIGEALTLTATVSAKNGLQPTGPVVFYDGTTQIGTASINGSGIATTTFTLATSGTHRFKAVYQGDTQCALSTSAILTRAVSATPVLPASGSIDNVVLTPIVSA